MKRLIIISILILAIGSTNSIAQVLDSVRLILKWYDNIEFAGFYTAKEKGFYEDEGLLVEMETIINRDSVLQTLIEGEGVYGTMNSNVLVYRNEGIPLVVIMPILQHSPGVFFTYKNSNIRHPQELNGKSIIIPTRMFPELLIMMEFEGIDIDKTHIDSTWNIDGFNNREFDAISHYSLDISSMPFPDSIHMIRPIHYGVDFYGESLVTNELELTNNFDRVEKMRRATIRGWEYVFQNPDETIELIYNKYNGDSLSMEAIKAQYDEVYNLMMPNVVDVGHNNRGRWGEMINLMQKVNLLEEDFDVERMFLDDFREAEAKQFRKLIYISLLVILVIFTVVIILYFINKRLNKRIAQQTGKLLLQNEDLKKINRELDNIVYRVSHDLRSPLASSISIIELIRSDKETKTEVYLDLMEGSLKRLDSFIEDILSYARNARIEVEYEEVDIEKLIHDIVVGIKYQEREINVDILVENCEGFKSDAHRLSVLLSNLISNAFRYNDPEKDAPWIRISALGSNDHIAISVEDNGLGIPDNHVKKIFDMFYRAHDDRPGSGLGLYIVEEVVRKLNGTIEVKSTVQEGTTFTVTLPK